MLPWLYLAALLVFLVYRRTNSRYRDLERTFPGPPNWPFIGNAHHLALKAPNDIYHSMLAFCRQYDGAFRLWLGPLLYIVLYDPVDVEAILSTTETIDKATEYRLLEPYIGWGLITSTGEHWRKHRKLLTPAFHFTMLEKFVEIVQKNNAVLCEVLRRMQGGGAVDIHHYMKLWALDGICESSMGTEMNIQLNPDSEYVQAVHKETSAIFHRAMHLWHRVDWIFNLSPTGRESKKSLGVIHGVTNEVIKQRKQQFTTADKPKVDEFNVKERLAFLDILLQAAEEHNLSDEDIRAEVDTVMFAGHDTTASVAAFCLFSLAQHPQIQERAVQELRDIFGDDDRAPTTRDLQAMKYGEQVIKETMRMYPAVPVFGRAIKKDFQLPSGRYLPKGCEIAIPPAAIHRHPRYWKNPEVFNPDNFSPEAACKRHPFAYVPFSGGPRNCIGQRFAMLELKSMVCSVLRHFQLQPSLDPSHRMVVSTDLVLSSRTGLHLHVTERTDFKSLKK